MIRWNQNTFSSYMYVVVWQKGKTSIDKSMIPLYYFDVIIFVISLSTLVSFNRVALNLYYDLMFYKTMTRNRFDVTSFFQSFVLLYCFIISSKQGTEPFKLKDVSMSITHHEFKCTHMSVYVQCTLHTIMRLDVVNWSTETKTGFGWYIKNVFFY